MNGTCSWTATYKDRKVPNEIEVEVLKALKELIKDAVTGQSPEFKRIIYDARKIPDYVEEIESEDKEFIKLI